MTQNMLRSFILVLCAFALTFTAACGKKQETPKPNATTEVKANAETAKQDTPKTDDKPATNAGDTAAGTNAGDTAAGTNAGDTAAGTNAGTNAGAAATNAGEKAPESQPEEKK